VARTITAPRMSGAGDDRHVSATATTSVGADVVRDEVDDLRSRV